MTWDNWAASADRVPRDPDAFTTYVADRFRKLVAGLPVKITGTLSLEVDAAGNLRTLYLDSLLSNYQRRSDASPELVDDYVAKTVGMVRSSDPPVTRGSLRVVVRPKTYMEQLRETLEGSSAVPVTAPLAGDLIAMGASDLPTVIRMIDSRTLTRLQLSNDEAIALAKDNMRADFKATLRMASRESRPGINMISGGPYESSLLAFPELWAGLAKKASGNLLVSAPAADVVLFSDADSADAVVGFGHVTRATLIEAERPVSENIFRWSAEGWIVLH